MQQRLSQFREVQAQPVDRRGDKEIEVLREEEARQRRDHVRQHQDGYKGEQDEAQDLAGNQRTQLFDRAQGLENPIQHAEDADPERPADQREHNELAGAAVGALLTQAL